MVKHASIDAHRQSQTRNVVALSDTNSDGAYSHVYEDLNAKETFEEIEHAVMHNLSERERAVFTMKEYDGLSTEEIFKKSADLKDFCEIIDFVRNSNDVENSIRTYIEDTCIDILKNTAVFKDDEKGMHGVDKFIEGVNLWIITDQD